MWYTALNGQKLGSGAVFATTPTIGDAIPVPHSEFPLFQISVSRLMGYNAILSRPFCPDVGKLPQYA
jgi:hypothetical protein